MSTVAQPRTYEVKTYGCQMNGRPAGVPSGHDFRAANVEIR
jgi:hypothetical protein